MDEVMEEQELNHLKYVIQLKQISMFFKRETADDPRRSNILKAGEIAVIFDGENGEPVVSDFMVHSKTENNSNKNLNMLRQNCDPMVYPLIFLNGEPGWRPGIEHTTIKR
jgi:hypothetical protein